MSVFLALFLRCAAFGANAVLKAVRGGNLDLGAVLAFRAGQAVSACLGAGLAQDDRALKKVLRAVALLFRMLTGGGVPMLIHIVRPFRGVGMYVRLGRAAGGKGCAKKQDQCKTKDRFFHRGISFFVMCRAHYSTKTPKSKEKNGAPCAFFLPFKKKSKKTRKI